MADEYEFLRFEKADRIARLTLARPEQLNALSRPLLAEIIRVLDDIRDGSDVGVLVIAAEGRGFPAVPTFRVAVPRRGVRASMPGKCWSSITIR